MIPRIALGATLIVSAAATAQPYFSFTNFPTPAPGAFTVSAEALPDGRLLVWNGDALLRQNAVNADAFTAVATGYTGDTGFMAFTPSGATLILGAGFGGQIYAVDPANPQDFTAAAQVATESHYDGLMLTETILLIDLGKSDFSGSELRATDLAAKDGAGFRTVAFVPPTAKADLVLDKPPFSFSGSLAIDREAGIVYVMDSNALELRSFTVAALLDAFDTNTPLDWDTDGTPIGAPGDYYAGGVVAVTAEGNLIIDGAASFVGPAGVQIVDPGTAAVLDTLTPNGTDGYYSALYNAVTGAIILLNLGEAFSTVPLLPNADSSYPSAPAGTPAASAGVLLLAAAAVAGVGLGRITRSR